MGSSLAALFDLTVVWHLLLTYLMIWSSTHAYHVLTHMHVHGLLPFFTMGLTLGGGFRSHCRSGRIHIWFPLSGFVLLGFSHTRGFSPVIYTGVMHTAWSLLFLLFISFFLIPLGFLSIFQLQFVGFHGVFDPDD